MEDASRGTSIPVDGTSTASASPLPRLPLEVQLEILQHLYYLSPSSFARSALVLSTFHHKQLVALLYRHICVRDRVSLEVLASTLLARPDLAKMVRSFFFQGPQGRKRTGRELLLAWQENEDGGGDDDDSDEEASETGSDEEREAEAVYDENGWCEARGELEPGIEGEGQEATWDENESLMHLCTLILRICANNIVSCGFVDCVPWFLAPYEGGNLNFPLPRCRDFTGVTVGLFGLLPHLQREKQRIEGTNSNPAPNREAGEEEDCVTSLERCHLIGGDFGSFALQRVLIAAPTAKTLTHLHITAPTLYRVEHHSHLVAHITQLLKSNLRLECISVGFLRWHRSPPRRKKKKRDKDQVQHQTGGDLASAQEAKGLESQMLQLSTTADARARISPTVSSSTISTSTTGSSNLEPATGDDSFERIQLGGAQRRDRGREAGASSSLEHVQRQAEDERVQMCREAYVYALPKALEASERYDVEVSIIELPFVEESPVGFAGWILTQGQSEASAMPRSSQQHQNHQQHQHVQRLPRLAGPSHLEKSWRKRDLRFLPPNVADDGAPAGSIWTQEASQTWKLDRQGQAELIKGSL